MEEPDGDPDGASVGGDAPRTGGRSDRADGDGGSGTAEGAGESGDGDAGGPDGEVSVPAGVVDEDLYRRTAALLEPGEVELVGCVVHTDLGSDEDVEMMEATLEVGDVVAEAAGHDPGDVYVYSGNDDPEFASNQHQGLTIGDDAFVWECQQLLRDGTFDLVVYYEAVADHEAVLAELEARGYTVQGVEPDGG